MGFGSRAFLAGGLGFAAAFAVACGSTNGLLSADQNSSLTSQLDSISQAVGAHNCGQADSASAALTNAVTNLPSTINRTLSQNLNQGASTVSELAARDCSSSSTSSSTPSTRTTTTTTAPTTTTTSSTSSSSSSSSSSATATGTSSATNPPPAGTTSAADNGGATLKRTGTNGNGGNAVQGGNAQ